MGHEIARQLAQFTVDAAYDDIPPEVLHFTKGLILKTVAGMVAGAVHPSAQKVAGLVQDRGGRAELSVVGQRFKTSLWDAVFLNAFHAHARELEDDRFGGGVSWDITVIPLLLSLAEKLNLTGEQLLVAMVAGLEVHARTCFFSAEHRGLTIVPGAIGPAVAAAKALGLGVDQTMAAMGLSMSGANLSLANFGTDAHYLESSLHSLQGIMAAEMAGMGMTSNPDLTAFLVKLLGIEVGKVDDMVKGLGHEWLFTEIMIKKYPCCFLLHRQVDCLIGLKQKHNLSIEQVADIEVHGSPADQLCNRPAPQTEGDLQFSFQHALGAAMLDGDLVLDHFDVTKASSPELVEARSKVRVTIDPELSKIIMEEPARITIRTTDGGQLHAERQFPIGSVHDPLSDEGLRGVYRKFVKGLLPEDNVECVADAVLNIEHFDDVHGLMKLLT